MSSPIQSLFSPNSSRIDNRQHNETNLSSPRSHSSRVTTNVPETSVVSPRSMFGRSELEDNIHSLQSKILNIPSVLIMSR